MFIISNSSDGGPPHFNDFLQVMSECVDDGRPVGTLVIKRYDIMNEVYASVGREELPLWIPPEGSRGEGHGEADQEQTPLTPLSRRQRQQPGASPKLWGANKGGAQSGDALEPGRFGLVSSLLEGKGIRTNGRKLQLRRAASGGIMNGDGEWFLSQPFNFVCEMRGTFSGSWRYWFLSYALVIL